MYQAMKKLFFTEARCLDEKSTKSFEELFEKLDVNRDGKVDVAELRSGLASLGFAVGADAVQVKHHQKAFYNCFSSLPVLL